MKLLAAVLSIFIIQTQCLKILIYQTAIGHSHMSFSGALTDVLVDAGHEVHLLISEWNPAVKDDGTRRATTTRRIRLPPGGTTISHLAHLTDPFKMTVWKYFSNMEQMKIMKGVSASFCREILNDVELLDWLREQKFDAALTSMYDLCSYGLFHVTGIKPVIGYVATPLIPVVLSALGIDSPASYTQDMMFAMSSADEMNYWERAKNIFLHTLSTHILVPFFVSFQQAVFTEKFGNDFPSLEELASNTSFVFVNSNELFELPRPLSHKIVYIGGIALRHHKNISEEYSRLLSERDGTVLFSFGSLAKTSLMPIEMKISFVEAFGSFPNYTFIWKVDAEDVNDPIFKRYPNIKAVKWMPQYDLLRDGRINAFITHGGLNSVNEAIVAGVPMITMPLFADQNLNAATAVKRRVAYALDKWNINKERVTRALRALLYDKSYADNSKLLAEMMAKKPHKPRDEFLQYVEFASEFKSVGENLQLYSVHLSFIQLNCLDVIVPFAIISLLLLYLVFAIIRRTLKRIVKLKKE